MDVFLTGATGYIGGTVARHLIRDGHTVRGLTRTPRMVDTLVAAGIDPVLGELDDVLLLQREAERADAVVNTANSDHRGAIDTFIGALSGSGKVLIHTSGTSVIGDDAQGQSVSGTVYDDAAPFAPGDHPIRRARYAVDDMADLYHLAVTDPAAAGFCFAAVWGEGFARYALGANSRVRAIRARALGWQPSRPSVTDWIEADMPVP